MDFFSQGPDVEHLSHKEPLLLELRADPDTDGRCIRVYLELTHFQQRPNIEFSLTDPEENEVSATFIIEPVGWKLESTLHIRRPSPSFAAADPGGTIGSSADRSIQYRLKATLAYPDLGEIDTRSVSIAVPSSVQR